MYAVLLLWSATCLGQDASVQSVSRNKMNVSWHYKSGRIYFTMQAPTTGWVTIGFNTYDGTKGAYLLMGRLVNGKAEVLEHYTLAPGNYQTVQSLGGVSQVSHASGSESSGTSTITFSLPTKAAGKYQKSLKNGMEYWMILAYSQVDDFTHHSVMRTSVKIEL